MNKTWDLTILYRGFDDPDFSADVAALDGKIAEMRKFRELAATLSPEELLVGYLHINEDIASLAEKLFIYSNLRYSANTQDGEAASTMGVLMGKMSATAADSAALEKMVAAVPDIEDVISGNDYLREHEYLLTKIVKDSKYLLSDAEEELFAEMNISGASAWSDLQSSLTSSVKVDYNGETITLSAVRNLAYDPSPEVRRTAYEAELSAYDGIKTSVAYALNSIKHQAIGEARRRGYASPLDKALHASRMEKETLERFKEQF